jgi:hypothetical protein
MYPMHPEDADFDYSTDAEIDRAHAVSGCDPDPTKCRCGGRGWVSSERDSQYECPYHYVGQSPFYEDYADDEYDDGGEEAERIHDRQVAQDAERFYADDSGQPF